MKREQKYPDTDTFHFHNANPKGRYTADCVTRAICTATGLTYEGAVMAQAAVQIKYGVAFENDAIDKVLKDLGWTKHKQPRKADGKKYTGEEFCHIQFLMLNAYFPTKEVEGITISNRIVANVGGNHTVAIVDGRIWDTWDSTDGCVGNYWTKEA